jgi:hypothetical protein
VAGGYDERGAGALSFQDSIRRGSCSVVDELEGTRPAILILEYLSGLCDTVLNPNALIRDGGRNFGSNGLSMRGEDVNISECTTNVYTQLISLIYVCIGHDEA